MTPINYVVGDATAPPGTGTRVVAHVCNDAGAWGRGFVMAVSRRWPEPEAHYRSLTRDRRRLGETYLVPVGQGLLVANMIAQVLGDPTGVNVRYDALDACLGRLGYTASCIGGSVHMPRIGCGLAGGRWELVEPLVARNLSARGVPVTVYDPA